MKYKVKIITPNCKPVVCLKAACFPCTSSLGISECVPLLWLLQLQPASQKSHIWLGRLCVTAHDTVARKQRPCSGVGQIPRGLSYQFWAEAPFTLTLTATAPSPGTVLHLCGPASSKVHLAAVLGWRSYAPLPPLLHVPTEPGTQLALQ